MERRRARLSSAPPDRRVRSAVIADRRRNPDLESSRHGSEHGQGVVDGNTGASGRSNGVETGTRALCSRNEHVAIPVKAPDQKLLQIAQLLSDERGLSQRDIFLRLDMAQGLINRYLKLLARRGWIKLTTAPAKRMRYWMTPKGMKEKSRLVMDFVSSNYRLFREAHREASNALNALAKRGARSIAFHGTGPIAEIAAMSLAENSQILVAVVEDGGDLAHWCGAPIIPLADVGSLDCDALVLIKPLDPRTRGQLPPGMMIADLTAGGFGTVPRVRSAAKGRTHER
jgi:hypothetical protein